jgi:high-affinity nickel-transport protein
LGLTRPRWTRTLTRREWARLGGFAGAVGGLHLLGIGLLVYYAGDYPVLTGLGWTAYLFGLRHAFDADHISAIDNSTRKLLQRGRRALDTGFFFALGHSTVVLVLAVGIAVAASGLGGEIPHLHAVGAVVGPGISGAFLWAIGILNLLVLRDVVRVAGELRRGRFDGAALEQRLLERGLVNRVAGRLFGLLTRSRHMYPLGLVFGLGFDTATEVGLLAVTAGTASGSVPLLAILALPLLFAAGMTLMDTADGLFMAKAYGWALSSPVRKVYYNLAVTSLSVLVALVVGSIQLLQVLANALDLRGAFFGWLASLDFEVLGYVIAGLFVVSWAGALAVWKLRRVEERWGVALARTQDAT